MNAVISGRAGVAILVDGERILSLEVDDDGPPVPRTSRDIRFMLGDARDAVFLDDVSIDEVRHCLRHTRDDDDALQLALFLLDAELSDGARENAASVLEEQLCVAIQSVTNVLFAHPLPNMADRVGAIRCAARANARGVTFLFERLGDAQPHIEHVWRAWEALSPSLFSSEDERVQVRVAFVQEGIFWYLATALLGPDIPPWQLQYRPAVQNHWAIFRAWVMEIRRSAKSATAAFFASRLEKQVANYVLRVQIPEELDDDELVENDSAMAQALSRPNQDVHEITLSAGGSTQTPQVFDESRPSRSGKHLPSR
jgi:hypothetical protein